MNDAGNRQPRLTPFVAALQAYRAAGAVLQMASGAVEAEVLKQPD